MKKVFFSILTFLLILLIIVAGLFLIIKNELKTEKIKERINEIGAMYNYSINMDNIRYGLSYEGLIIEMDSLNVLSEYIQLSSKTARIKLNFFGLLKRELIFEGIYIKNGYFEVKEFVSDNEKDTSQSIQFPDIRFIKIENSIFVFDTLKFYNINLDIYLNKKEKLSIVGNISFIPNINKIEKLGNIVSDFNVVLSDTIDIKKLIIKNKYNILFSLKGKMYDNTLEYNSKCSVNSFDFLYKTQTLNSNELILKGKSIININGIYEFNKTLKYNIVDNINSLNIKLNNLKIKTEEIDLKTNESINIVKQENNILLSGPIEYKEKSFDIYSTVNIEGLFDKWFDFSFVFNADIFDLYSVFSENEKLYGKGNIDIDIMGKIPIDSIASLNYMKKTLNGKFSFKNIFFKYDTLSMNIRNGLFNLKDGHIKGYFDVNKKNNNINVNMDYNITRETLNSNIQGNIFLNDFIKDVKGDGYIKGVLKYDIKREKLEGKFKGNIENVYSRSVNDTFNIKTAKILIDKKNIKLLDIFLRGKHIDAYMKESDIEFENKDIFINSKINVKFVNLDSLFPIKNKDIEDNKNIKISFDKKLHVNINGKFDKAIFRDEEIKNGEYKLKIEKGALYVEQFKASLLKGEVFGNVSYFPENDYLIIMNINTEHLDIEAFNNNHNISPYAIGGNVNSKSNIEFNQFQMQSTLDGKVYIEVDNGWMENPALFKNLSKLFRRSLSDTFYFDEMIGEFDIKDELVSFEDFYMNKHGHSLLYSGNVDFEKNLYINGKYTVNMKYADIGIIETILKKAGYKADTVFVDFEIIGDYKLPVVEIKDNSIKKYFKNKTNEFFRNLF